MDDHTGTWNSQTEYQPIECWEGRAKDESGRYIKVRVPEHPRAFYGWVHEHTLVAEQKLGRLLKHDETVHHICGRHDNRPSALLVCEREEHVRIHQ